MKPRSFSTPPDIPHLLESLAIPFTTAEYAPPTSIFRQGDSSNDVLLIERGLVLLAVSTRQARAAICGVLGIGAFLGEETLIGRGTKQSDTWVDADSQTLRCGC